MKIGLVVEGGGMKCAYNAAILDAFLDHNIADIASQVGYQTQGKFSKTSAKNNTQKDFEFSYFDDIDDALIEGLSQNQDFFSLLLSNDEMKRQVLGIFADEIYKSLRNAD